MVKLADPIRSIEFKRALPLMEKTTFKNASEHAYMSGLLWREEEPSLPNNYEMAKRRLQSLEKKFESCPEVRERYAKSIQDDIEKGLNDKINTGSDLLSSLFGVFLRFCEGRLQWLLRLLM